MQRRDVLRSGQLVRSSSEISAAVSPLCEILEARRLLCSDGDEHGENLAPPQRPTGKQVIAVGRDHKAGWYKATGKVTLSSKAVAKAFATAGETAAAAAVADPVTFSTNSAGLPLLNSRPDGGGLKVFIDWDGASGNGYSDDGFSTDSDLTTFNTAEQAVIYSTWRDIVSAFSMLNVNVTTVQPPVGGSNPAFVWQRITNSRAGGAAYVNWIVNYESHGYNNSDNALYRHSGIYHELGHQLGLDHQSAYDNAGNKTDEYISGYDTLHGTIMGTDYNGNIKKWVIGRDTYAADSFQDDLADMSGTVAYQTGTDGFKPDDFTGTTLSGATTLSLTNGAYRTAGNIERLTDADFFKITTTANGAWDFNVEPTFQSPLEPKLEVYDASGKLLASVSDALYRNGQDNNSEELNLTLPAGSYYAKVSGAQNAGDQGEYAFYATPLPAGWNSADVNRGNTGRGGYVTYDNTTGTFYQGGSGGDIWGTSDAFRFSYQTLTGDGSITARVDRLDNTSNFAKAGVMIRQSMAANSAHVYVGIKPSGELETITRGTAGASAANVVSTAGQVGPWVRLTRAGNVFTLAKSADGSTWTTLGTTTVTMSGPVYIGLATNSQNFGVQTTSAFSNVTTTGNLGPVTVSYNGLTPPANLTAAAVAAQTTAVVLNWTDGTGETGYRIERSLDNSNFSPIGTVGANVTTYTDNADGWGAMRYWYRVTALTSAGISAYSSAANALNKPGQPALLQAIKMSPTRLSLSWRDVNGDSGYRVERSADGGATYTTLGTTGQNFALWNDGTVAAGTAYTYRVTPLSSVGDGVPLLFNVITQLPATASIALSNSTSNSLTVNWSAVTNAAGYRVYRSTDNATWTQVGTVNGGSTVSYADTGLAALANYYYYVVAVSSDGTAGQNSATAKGSTAAAAALPTPWADVDIGGVTGIGKAGYAGAGAFTVNTSGSDIANPDSFNFVYQAITGNTTIVAKIASLGVSDNAAKAGLMVRQNLTSNTAAYAGIFLNAGNGYGVDVRSRATAGGNYTYGQALANVAAPYWLKLSRSGNVFTMSYSTDGVTYTTATTRTVSMSGTVYVGLAATASSTTLMNQAAFTNVKITSAAPTVATAASASPNPVTGKTASLTVLGADDGGEANLSYTWSATGPAAVTYSANGTNAAKNAVATFTKAGTYTLTATITDGGFNSVTSSVTVTVAQTFAGVAAASPSMVAGFAQQTNAVDQFGNTMAVSGIVWSASVGTISTGGVYTAPATGAASATLTGTVGSTAYSTTVQIVAPRAWYKADNTGSTLVDSSGNNYTATLSGAYTQGATGEIGSAVTLSGGYATTPAAVINGLTDFTVSLWVKPTATTNWGRAFDFGTGTNAYMFLAPADGNGYVRFAITTGGNGGEQTVTTTTTLPINAWSHLAVTLSGTVATLYINGAAVGTNTAMTLNPASLGNTTQNYVGKSQFNDPTFKGGVDDFRVYGQGLTATNVADLYNAGVAASTSTPGSVTATATAPTKVNVTWADNSTAEIGYLVERATNAAFTDGLVGFNTPANTTSCTDATAAAGTSYYYRVTALLGGGTTAGPVAAPVVTTPVATPTPTVSKVAVNDGAAQRSTVRGMTITIDGTIPAANIQSGAFVLTQNSAATGASIGSWNVSVLGVSSSNGQTTVTLGFDGSNALYGSIADGRYTLTINGSLITNNFGQQIDAAGTGTAGSSRDVTFHRLIADANGDGSVNFSDFLILQGSFLSTAGSSNYNIGTDINGDGTVNFSDFLLLQGNFLRTL